MTNESFAQHLGVAVRTVAYWRKQPGIIPQASIQEALDTALDRASARAKFQFSTLMNQRRMEVQSSQSEYDGGREIDPLSIGEWKRDDLARLSLSFDTAVGNSAVADIERLAHVWLISEPPQLIELSAGRRISDELVATVEHRVIQLRRADDFITGIDAHELVRSELAATSQLLNEASLADRQAKRLLTAVGEIAQLGAWIAADMRLLDDAARYVRGGLVAAHAACDAPLAGNLISTFSYQVANMRDPREAGILARTAYQGAYRDASPITNALLLERIAWSEALSGDIRGCEKTLGRVEDSFSAGARDDDPDWVYWLNREEIDVMAGRCYTELHKPARAESLLRGAIGRYNQTLIRENSLYLSWLAEDYIQLGDIDQAAEIATRMAALATRTNSGRTDNRLRHVAERLKPYSTAGVVAGFFDAYELADVHHGGSA
jgi:tetratricopeptide (TPR) repeat protein